MKPNENKLVELKPLKPFSGSYICKSDVADEIRDEFVENEQTGVVSKQRIARKRFVGLVGVQRRAWPNEVLNWKTNGVPPTITVVNDLAAPEVWVLEAPEHPTVKVPEDIAADLVKRGLAEKIAA